MKMKELVIKIPEDMYKLIMNNIKVLQEREVFIKAIQNGTVLPEKQAVTTRQTPFHLR